MVVVIEHEKSDAYTVKNVFGPFADTRIAMDWAKEHLNGTNGDWYWASLTSPAEIEGN